ncbi:MAG TPA: ASCH domain-containing protein [Thermoanaerobaculia bacterium]|jgi:hypothetical protein
MPTLNAVPIRTPFVGWILDGKKTWEIRSRSTNIRGRIALIEGGSGTVVGTCDLVEVIGPLTEQDVRDAAGPRMNSRPKDCDGCVGQFAWVLADVRRLVPPVPYTHPSGAVTWVKLDETKAAEVLAARSVPAGSPAARQAPAPPVRRQKEPDGIADEEGPGEDLAAKVARLEAENAALKKENRPAVSLKVSDKGGVSLYGLGRFPITLYKEQWLTVLGMADELRAFIAANNAKLKTKE